jgi:transglutaminase-like putative cysteine protease
MRLRIQHRTAYHYAAPASYSIQLLRLTPQRGCGQSTISWRIEAPGRCVEQVDAFGNVSHLLTLDGAHGAVVVNAGGTVETNDAGDGRVHEPGPLPPLAYVAATRLTSANGALRQLAALAFRGAGADAAGLLRLMELVTSQVKYRPGSTQVSDTASEVVVRGEGVCQDQAHVAIAACRAAGIPARYVSGHILSPDAHATSHAWVDVWLAQAGCWLSGDVTNRQLAGPRLCRLAVGRDYLDAAPVRGMRRGGGREQRDVKVVVSEQ